MAKVDLGLSEVQLFKPQVLQPVDISIRPAELAPILPKNPPVKLQPANLAAAAVAPRQERAIADDSVAVEAEDSVEKDCLPPSLRTK